MGTRILLFKGKARNHRAHSSEFQRSVSRGDAEDVYMVENKMPQTRTGMASTSAADLELADRQTVCDRDQPLINAVHCWTRDRICARLVIDVLGDELDRTVA